MSQHVAQSILDAEQAYKKATEHVTQVCLEVEKNCPHSIWSGKDWESSNFGGASFNAIYICLHCRMEVHVPYASYLKHETPPGGSLVVPLTQIGLGEYTQLRVWGDRRGHLHLRYSLATQWPKREEIEEMTK
jgi:hypothetical protein